MLMLLFYVGDERYAIASRQIVEVLPLVSLKKVHQAPEYIAGIFNYRGAIVPVIDISTLIQGDACQRHLSTRIIMVSYKNSNNLETTPSVLGLMAERVTETLNISENNLIDSGITVDCAPYLGKIITDEQGMIQCIQVENLLPESQRADLLLKS